VDGHAAIWCGTAGGWVDLSTSLGAGYGNSGAYGIQVTGSDIWVAGYAANYTLGRSEAVLWHNVIPEPSGLLALGAGLLAMAGMIRRKSNS